MKLTNNDISRLLTLCPAAASLPRSRKRVVVGIEWDYEGRVRHTEVYPPPSGLPPSGWWVSRLSLRFVYTPDGKTRPEEDWIPPSFEGKEVEIREALAVAVSKGDVNLLHRWDAIEYLTTYRGYTLLDAILAMVHSDYTRMTKEMMRQVQAARARAQKV